MSENILHDYSNQTLQDKTKNKYFIKKQAIMTADINPNTCLAFPICPFSYISSVVPVG